MFIDFKMDPKKSSNLVFSLSSCTELSPNIEYVKPECVKVFVFFLFLCASWNRKRQTYSHNRG